MPLYQRYLLPAANIWTKAYASSFFFFNHFIFFLKRWHRLRQSSFRIAEGDAQITQRHLSRRLFTSFSHQAAAAVPLQQPYFLLAVAVGSCLWAHNCQEETAPIKPCGFFLYLQELANSWRQQSFTKQNCAIEFFVFVCS